MSDNKFNVPLGPATNISDPENETLGSLVKNTLEQTSNLIRGEVALVKADMSKQVVKIGVAIGLFLTALTLILYSTYFLFFSIATGLGHFMPDWVGFLIVFFLVLLLSVVFILVGIWLLKKLDGPKKSVDSIKESATAFKGSNALKEENSRNI